MWSSQADTKRVIGKSYDATMMLRALSRATARPSSLRALSSWANVPMGPPDPIIGLNVAFREDAHPDKARRDSAEDFCRLKARRCKAMAWIFIPAYCFAIP